MDMMKAGFCGFGCTSYPRDILLKRTNEAKKAVRSLKINFIDAGFSSTFEEANKSIDILKRGDFDFLIVCISSWIETPIVIKVIREFRHKPVLLWGLGGYTKNKSLVSPAAQAGTTALRETMERMDFRFKYIYEWPDSPMRVERIKSFARVANTIQKLSQAKIGMMGYADMGLYGTMFDGVSLRSKIGPEVEAFDMLEVVQEEERVNKQKLSNFIKKIKRDWKFEKPVADETLKKLAGLYLAIDKIAIERNYAAISLKCVEGMKRYMNFPPCLILSLIGDRIPAICEDDALGLVTQLILKYITNQATTFMEMYEFMKKDILVGVCGFCPGQYVSGPKKASIYGGWGGLNQGVMNTSRIKTGQLTLARLGYRGEDYYMHIVTGEGKDPGRWEELGWNPPAPQFPGLKIALDTGVEEFAKKIISQHYLLVYGDHRESLEDICSLLDIRVIK